MARLLVDGFETGTFLGNWTVNGANITISNAVKKTGNYSLKINNDNVWITSPIATTGPTIYFKFHLYFSSWASGANLEFMKLGNAEGLQFSIGLGPVGDRRIRILRGDMGGTLLGVAFGEIDLNTWHLIEGKITLDNSVGVIEVKVDGVAAPGLLGASYTGDTLAQTTANFTWVQLGPSYNSLAYATYYVDGFVLDNANWIGDSRIVGIVPSGAGLSTQWTPSTGSNYACVDEVPPNDSDYIGVNTNDQLDLYTHANLPAEAYIIKSVSILARVVKEGASTPQNVKLALNIDGDGSSPRLSSNIALSYVMRWVSNLWETNPATGNPFTPAELNAAQFGVKSAA